MRFLFALVLTTLIADAAGQPMMPGDPSFLQSTSSLRKGLVGYWRLEESSGTRYDCSPYGNHLTANNSPGQAAGKVGNCATFTRSSSQNLSVNSTSITNDTPFTLTCWMNLTDLSNSSIMAVDDGSFREFNLFYNSTFSQIHIYHFSGGLSVASTTPISQGTWYFVAAGWDTASNIWISVNAGATNSSYIPTLSHAKTAFTIGGPGGAYANAKVDEAGFWKRQLSQAEIAQLYNSGLGTHFPWAHK